MTVKTPKYREFFYFHLQEYQSKSQFLSDLSHLSERGFKDRLDSPKQTASYFFTVNFINNIVLIFFSYSIFWFAKEFTQVFSVAFLTLRTIWKNAWIVSALQLLYAISKYNYEQLLKKDPCPKIQAKTLKQFKFLRSSLIINYIIIQNLLIALCLDFMVNQNYTAIEFLYVLMLHTVAPYCTVLKIIIITPTALPCFTIASEMFSMEMTR